MRAILNEVSNLLQLNTEDVLYKNALLEGDKLIDRNKFIYESMNIEYNLMRRADWLHILIIHNSMNLLMSYIIKMIYIN